MLAANRPDSLGICRIPAKPAARSGKNCSSRRPTQTSKVASAKGLSSALAQCHSMGMATTRVTPRAIAIMAGSESRPTILPDEVTLCAESLAPTPVPYAASRTYPWPRSSQCHHQIGPCALNSRHHVLPLSLCSQYVDGQWILDIACPCSLHNMKTHMFHPLLPGLYTPT